MAKLFAVMGKSATGKDTIVKKLKGCRELTLKEVIPYTTRPIRKGEVEGREYHFVSDAYFGKLKERGKVIECRSYHTTKGTWNYFTVDDGSINLEESDYIMITTLEGYKSLLNYYGRDKVQSVYIEVEDGIRIQRALDRENMQKVPDYSEMCRRYLADEKDFSEERLNQLHIEQRYKNINLDLCIHHIVDDILNQV